MEFGSHVIPLGFDLGIYRVSRIIPSLRDWLLILFKMSCGDIIPRMDISLTTPALLFPTVSLLMLAYTNRFLTLASIIRNLHDRYKAEDDAALLHQIANLRYRIYLIRDMQIAGLLSLLFCVISMFALFAGWLAAGQWSFAIALILMIVSMVISLRELQVSVGALDVLLGELEDGTKKGK
jgi:hypothetical protein